jgi:hypothetical protein
MAYTIAVVRGGLQRNLTSSFHVLSRDMVDAVDRGQGTIEDRVGQEADACNSRVKVVRGRREQGDRLADRT